MLGREQMISRMSEIWTAIAAEDPAITVAAAVTVWAILPYYKLAQHYYTAIAAAERKGIDYE